MRLLGKDRLVRAAAALMAVYFLTACGQTVESEPAGTSTSSIQETSSALATPTPTTAAETTEPSTVPTETTRQTYEVKAGDSWWDIAAEFEVDINALAELNGRTTEEYVKTGEKLLIPEIDETAATPRAAETTAASATTGATSAATIVQELASGTRYTTDYLNMRSEPHVGATLLLTIPPATPVELLAYVPTAAWYQVSYGGKTGYVNGGWLSETPPSTTTTSTTAVTGTVSPDGRSGNRLDTPYVKNGIILVNKKHWVSANYAPVSVSSWDDKSKLTDQAMSAWLRMQSAAAATGHTLVFQSGYRSYRLQEYLYENYAAQDGYAAANRYSAKPGQSEHQTGLALDIVDDRGWTGKNGLNERASGQWLREHAHEFGWILRYPQGKEAITGYMYEPWHYRYLGAAAMDFGPYSTMTLEEYLGEA